MTEPVDDEQSFIFDADIPRIDLVGKGANGMPFIIAKGKQGLFAPDAVRDLIKDAAPAPGPVVRDDVTMSGSPAAMAEMINKAAQRAARQEPPQLPTEAVQTAQYAAAYRELIEAERVGVGSWVAKDGTVTSFNEASSTTTIKEPPVTAPVVKDVVPDASDIIADGGGSAQSMPGSADWETMDAETAQAAIGLLGRVKGVLEWLIERETVEAVTDDGDGEHVWDLSDTMCAVEAALDTLAGYAVGEQLEAEMVDDLAAIGKALSGLDETGLAKIEKTISYTALMKAGRSLNSVHEGLLRAAKDNLDTVLSSLPAVTPDDVAKEAQMTEPTPEPTEPDDAAVVKAKGDPLSPVYNEAGKLVGMVDPGNLIPIQPAGGGAPAAPTNTDDGAPADANDGPQAPQAGAAAPAAPAATTPAAPAAVAKSETEEEMVPKSAVDDLVKAATLSLEARLEKLEAQPFPDGPMLNGATPGADRVARRGDPTEAVADLRKQYEDERNPLRKAELQMALAAQLVRDAPQLR